MTVSVVAVVTDVSLLRSLKCEAHRTADLAPHHSVLRIGRARVVGGGQPVRVGLGVGPRRLDRLISITLVNDCEVRESRLEAGPA
jgi:hypothetical protein